MPMLEYFRRKLLNNNFTNYQEYFLQINH